MFLLCTFSALLIRSANKTRKKTENCEMKEKYRNSRIRLYWNYMIACETHTITLNDHVFTMDSFYGLSNNHSAGCLHRACGAGFVCFCFLTILFRRFSRKRKIHCFTIGRVLFWLSAAIVMVYYPCAVVLVSFCFEVLMRQIENMYKRQKLPSIVNDCANVCAR